MTPIIGNDYAPTPPDRVEISSPSADYVLALTTADSWKSRLATATLYETRDGTDRAQIWSRRLPHDLGPRYALVGNDGRVLLLDEYINVTSRFAVMLLDRTGAVVAQHSHAKVVEAVGQSARAISAKARHGVWISGAPVLDAKAGSATVAVAGTHLTIRLSDGSLTVGR